MTAGGTRRWGFRARLTALIALVFVAGGAVLLGVQYLLTQQLFEDAMGTITTCATDEGVSVTTGSADDGLTGECASIIEATRVGRLPDGAEVEIIPGPARPDAQVLIEQTAFLSREVLSGLLIWSIVTLVAFTVVAVVAASWLSRRSFARIGQITETTKQITRDDLHQRLELPGPGDEIKELGDTIDTMLDRLEASFTQQERFILNASHELRTPLTTTRAALEVPLAQGLVPERLEPSIRKALAANERSETIIAALLALARVKTVSLDDARQPLDLADLARQAVESCIPDADSEGIEITASLAPAPIDGVDETILTLAIENLIGNAAKHNIPHGSVAVTTGTDGGSSWIEVTNTGHRISAGEAKHFTEPFNRGAGTRTSQGKRGLGLGLTLVENVATSVGATLSITPGALGGLTVRLSFTGAGHTVGVSAKP